MKFREINYTFVRYRYSVGGSLNIKTKGEFGNLLLSLQKI